MTVDEELTALEDAIRKLKIEYDTFFGGGSKRPPDDTEWRVRNLIKKYSDGRALTFQQKFRYNTVAQKYAVFSDLWRRKLKIKEEGYRRPQDALLAIQGLRPDEERAAAEALDLVEKPLGRHPRHVELEFSDPKSELHKAQALFEALVAARQRIGEESTASFDSFHEFLVRKTGEIRNQFGCASVEYAVAIESGQVKLKAKAKN